ncbi:MAG: MGDG synthase family glycosyltransferase [Vulcanimicrobiaceae bacterium]
MAARVLFLSASVGVGHTAAARAVEGALRARDPSVCSETVDSYAYAASIFAKVVADGYIGMVKTVPQVYRYLYGRVERSREVPALRRAVGRFAASNLRALVASERPDLIVCTHAFPCGVMAEYKRHFDPSVKVVGVVTDFVVHPFWIYGEVDAYAVATPEMAACLHARGIAPERIVISGIPIDPRFGQARLSREQLRDELRLPRDRRIVLVMGGGVGLGPLERIMRALDRVRTPIAAAVIVGRNPGLERRVLAAAERTSYPLRVYGFVDNVHDFMHASDVLISKPGGLTSAEALAAGLPMVLVRPLPGQEERNAEYLVSRGAALRAPDDERLAARVEEVFAGGEPAWALRSRIAQMRRPDAARQVAERLAGLLAPQLLAGVPAYLR